MADPDIVVDSHVFSEHAIVAERGVGFDHRAGADASAYTELCRRVDDCGGMDGGLIWLGRGSERTPSHGESVARIADPEDASVVRFELAESSEDRARLGVERKPKRVVVLREDDGVGSGLVNRGDATQGGLRRVRRAGVERILRDGIDEFREIAQCECAHQYRLSSPSGRVFQRRWTQSHCSGYRRIHDSMVAVKRAVLASASAAASPVRATVSSGPKCRT